MLSLYTCQVKVRPKRHIVYRSYKHFNVDAYKQHLSETPFHVAEVFDSIDDSYWFCQTLLQEVINEHAPTKRKIVKHNQAPYMNCELRKSMNVRDMLRRKFERQRCNENWDRYRRQRNLVVKLRKKSKQEYLKRKCVSSGNSKEFWSAVKPLLSHKNKSTTETVLVEKGIAVNSPSNIVNILNAHFVNVAAEIGPSDMQG